MATPATVTDLAPYRQDVEVVEAQTSLRTVADEARELLITDEATNAVALDLLGQVRKAGKRIDALKRRWLDPLNAQVKLIREDFAAMAAPAAEADRILSQKTSTYRAMVQEKARKEEERLRLLAEKRQERAAERAEERGLEAPPVIPIVPTVATPAKTVATESGAKITYRKTPHMEITDPDAVPRQFCSPDEKKCRAALTSGIVSEIPGVRYWVTEEATVR
jgi:hypothetical protein